MSLKPLCPLLLAAVLVPLPGCDPNPNGPSAPSPSSQDTAQGFPKDAPVKGQAK